MLDAGTAVVITKFLDLALAHAVGWLVDRHLDVLVEVSHDHRAQRRVVCVNLFVVNRPEAMEIQHLLVPTRSRLHLAIGLVANAMIYTLKIGAWQHVVQKLFEMVRAESW